MLYMHCTIQINDKFAGVIIDSKPISHMIPKTIKSSLDHLWRNLNLVCADLSRIVCHLALGTSSI